MRKEQVIAVSKLFEMMSRSLNAMLLLLRNDLWEEAVSLLARSTSTATENVSAQLFDAMLHEALRKKNVSVLPKIWPFLPKTMKPLDFAHIISSYTSTKRTPLPLDSNAVFTVGLFRDAFMKLLEADSKNS